MRVRPIITCALVLGAILTQSCAHAGGGVRGGSATAPAAIAAQQPSSSASVSPADSSSGTRSIPTDTLAAATTATPRVRPMVELLTEADSVVRARGGARAEHARLFLSWRAPWGQPRATTALVPTLRDTNGVDTLYLCMRPGRSSPTFNGFMATLDFRCAPGDTLGAFWAFERTGSNAGALGVQFGPEPEFPCPQPWVTAGVGRPAWTRTPTGGQLRLVFAVPYTQAGSVDSAGVYALARVLIRHQRSRLSGSAQPMCIEWTESSLAFALKDEPVVRQGERFVSWNSPRGEVCDTWRDTGKPQPWSPVPKRRVSR